MNVHDDFPLSPACWADDSVAFYKALLKAEDFLAALPPKARGNNPDRLLHKVACDLYASRDQSGSLMRAASGADEARAAVWVSKVRTLAQWLCAATQVPAFTGLSKADLQVISKLSADVSKLHVLDDVLLDRGIILVHERAIPGAKVDGVVFKLKGGNPVIGMSLRYPRLDHYWFTLMHELSHVVLHIDMLDSPIVDDLDGDSHELFEKQANKLSADSMIPSHLWRTFPAKASLDETDIKSFAADVGIAPQIAAGRLRREMNRHDVFTPLMNSVNVREMLFGQD
jgi:HTH-type transcriptional regulator/antitoxin HigA